MALLSVINLPNKKTLAAGTKSQSFDALIEMR